MTTKKQHKHPRYLLRNSAGNPDGMFTMAWIFCIVISLNALIGMFAGSEFTFTTALLSGTIRIPGFEWETIPALLTTVTGYVLRRNKSSESSTDEATTDGN